MLPKIKNCINNKNIKNSLIYTFFLFFNNGLSFILLLILANYLLPNEYGELSLFTTYISLLQIVICLSSSAYVTVAFFHKNINDIQKIIISIIAISTIILFILELIIHIDPSKIENIIGFPILFVSLGIFICYFQVINNLNLDLWRLEEKPFAYGLYNFSYALLNFVLTLWFVIELKKGWTSRPYAWLIISSIYFIISGLYLTKRGYIQWIKPSSKIIKEILYYSLPLIPHSISYWIKQGADRYILNYYYNTEAVGYFSFAMNLASIVVMVGTAFNSSNSVYIFKNLQQGYNKVKKKLRKQEKIVSFTFIFIGAIILTLVTITIQYIFPKYINSIVYMIPLMIGAIFQCIYLLFVNYIFYYKKTPILMLISLTTALIQIILSIFFTRYSTIYTAYISMFMSILTAISVFIYSKKLVNEADNYNAA